MNFEEVKAFMKEVGYGDLATTDGETVGVRPMGGWAWFDEELWCATGTDTDKVAQLRKNPHAEYCFCSKDGQHLRVAGPCTISTDNEVKLKLYKAVPILEKYIPDPTAPSYAVICMKPDNVRFMDADHMQYEKVKM